MAVCDVAYPTTPCPSAPDVHAPSDESTADDIDDLIVLSPDHAKQVARLRNEIRLCKIEPEKYELCVRMRNDLLGEHTGIQLLATTYEHIMFTQYTEFLGVAKDGLELKSKCLSSLKTVACYWGPDVIQHYQLAYKGRKYCDKLCAAAWDVHEFNVAVKGLNWSMLERSQQGMSQVFPLEDRPAIRLPNGFGFDNFSLMVHKEYAVMLPEPDSDGATGLPTSPEVGNVDLCTGPSRPNGTTIDLQRSAALDFLTESADVATLTSNQPSAEDTAATPLETLPALHSPSGTDTGPMPTGMTLRARPEMSYRESSGGGGPSKPKPAWFQSAKAPKIPPWCCPSEVPSTLLSALDSPFMFGPEAAE
ncbi:hypothetical protein B0T25DRAFT_573417 [Lasiosphaeria hispida]|uniref:Uncharacterized protein n=1 Tax=Lasiosphaeria hispida TaxID=260671 RepID=A0AAJ0H9W2_9PEZI|nr:hypothetical protein B0T25DRAFT_573417 [Lasiosphaeria hispida]